MMRGAHHHAHFICRLLVLRIVGIESPAPHGWPHHVAPEAQHQFEDALVEAVVAILGAVCILHPRGEARCFVVEEDATISDGWFAIGIDSLVYEDGIVMNHGHVSPVIPRRYAHLLGEFVDAIDGASAVASCDDELLIYEGDDEFLALALELSGIDAFLAHQLVDGGRMAQGSYQDAWLGVFAMGTAIQGGEGSLTSAYLTEVLDKCLDRIAYTLAVVGIHIDFNPVAWVEKYIALMEMYELLGCLHAERREQGSA